MHDNVTGPKGPVVVTLKSKMAASSASSGRNIKYVVFDLSENSKKSPKQLLDGQATSEHISFGEIRRHIGFVRDYNYHNARLSRKSIVLRHCA